MTNVKVGKYVKTHGIKGEIKIRSDFKYKDRVFKKGMKILIGNQKFIINSYRQHQEFDMITLHGITNINEILPLKGSYIYINKNALNLQKDEYLDTDLLNLEVVVKDKIVGKVEEIININKDKKLLVVNSKYIPFELIKKVDLENQKIEIEEVVGLL